MSIGAKRADSEEHRKFMRLMERMLIIALFSMKIHALACWLS
jgi:hypothetical protein